jgi:hypothetical protein
MYVSPYPVIDHVALVSDQDPIHVHVRVLLYLTHPVADAVERPPVCDVIDQQNPLPSRVVNRVSHGNKAVRPAGRPPAPL